MMTCPTGKLLIPDPQHTPCANATCCQEDAQNSCGTADVETCCKVGESCASFPCPADYGIIPNAEKERCQDAECKDTDYTLCCVQHAQCQKNPKGSGYSCPKGKVAKQNGMHFCAGISCAATPATTASCCDDKQTCDNFACHAHSDGKVLRALPATLFCKNATCSTGDADTCCEPKASCKHDFCHSVGSCKCVETDGVSWVPKADLETHSCLLAKCDDVKDLASCCRTADHCSHYACPENHIHIADYLTTPCKESICNADDKDVCCVERDQCHKYACPRHWKRKSDVDSLFCQNATCSRAKTVSWDTYECCDPVIVADATTEAPEELTKDGRRRRKTSEDEEDGDVQAGGHRAATPQAMLLLLGGSILAQIWLLLTDII